MNRIGAVVLMAASLAAIGCNRSISDAEWDRCTKEALGGYVVREHVERDHVHGISITMYGETGKSISHSIYPSEARALSKLLADEAGDAGDVERSGD